MKEIFILTKNISAHEQQIGWGGLSFHQINSTTFGVGTDVINMVDVKEMVEVLEHLVIDQLKLCFEALPGTPQLLTGKAMLLPIDDDQNDIASFVVRWLGADGSVKHASSEDLGSKLATKLKALTKDEAKKWLDQYYMLNKYSEVLILLGSQIRTTQLRAMTLRSGVNAPRSVKFIPCLRSEDNVCCKAICLTEKQKVGSGGSSGEWA